MQEENTTVITEQPIQDEVKQLLTELKSNNLNGNEIIQIQADKIEELEASLLEIRDTLLDMLTRGENNDSTNTNETLETIIQPTAVSIN